MVQIFVSHTRKDIEFCDKFDRIFAREENLKAFRSEFETIKPPAWETIKNAINNSAALVLLVGEGLVNNQKALFQDSNWKFTQNWIAFEIGVACQKGIDVWALCDKGIVINFPMPYITNYVTVGIDTKLKLDFFRDAFKKYEKNNAYKYPYKEMRADREIWDYSISCPYEDCRIKFNLMQEYTDKNTITCPQCLKLFSPNGNHPRNYIDRTSASDPAKEPVLVRRRLP
jgi:hypothetical protein